MQKILVLLSTYNGKKFIKEQIDSIIGQKEVDVDLIIRDDGSTDGTVEYLKKEYPNIEVMIGENLGYKKSFLHLLKEAPEYDYYAFADQDDVWLEDKLKIAIDRISHFNGPSFYCSNLMVVNEQLEFLSMRHKKSENIKMTEDKALVENISYGCTLVFNQQLREVALGYIPSYVSHDGWINLVGLYFGNGVYDEQSYILYRQHSTNVLGGNPSFGSVWKKRIRSFKHLGEHHRDLEAREFLDAFSERLSSEQKKKIAKVAFYRDNFWNKIILLLDREIRMSTFDRDFWYRIRVLFSCI